jgi:CRP-like cAMP-binding protein
VPLPLLLKNLFSDSEQSAPFMTYLEKIELSANTPVFNQGEPAEQIYFLESGQVATFVDLCGDLSETSHLEQQLREFTYKPGTIIGAAAFYTQDSYPSTAVTQEPSSLYVLTRDRWQAMLTEQPRAAAIFQETLITQLSGQIQRLNADLNVLLF